MTGACIKPDLKHNGDVTEPLIHFYCLDVNHSNLELVYDVDGFEGVKPVLSIASLILPLSSIVLALRWHPKREKRFLSHHILFTVIERKKIDLAAL